MELFFSKEKYRKFLESFFDKINSTPFEIQSFLLSGERNLGKFTIAYNFIKTLLCLDSKKKWGGCNNCLSCKLIEKNNHPDFKIIDPPFDTITIDEIRGNIEKGIEGVISFLSYYPQISPLRVVLINDAERMNSEAQNAFLKTLEEPPKHSLVILVTSNEQKLYKTLLSRLLILKFSRAPTEKLKKYLEKEYLLEEKEAEKIAKESNGKIGLAIKLLDNEFVKEREKCWQEFLTLINSDLIDRFNYFEKLFKEIVKEKELEERKETKKLKEILTIWLEKLEKEIKGETEEVPLLKERKIKLIKELLNAYDLISYTNVNPQLLLENIMLKI